MDRKVSFRCVDVAGRVHRSESLRELTGQHAEPADEMHTKQTITKKSIS